MCLCTGTRARRHTHTGHRGHAKLVFTKAFTSLCRFLLGFFFFWFPSPFVSELSVESRCTGSPGDRHTRWGQKNKRSQEFFWPTTVKVRSSFGELGDDKRANDKKKNIVDARDVQNFWTPAAAIGKVKRKTRLAHFVKKRLWAKCKVRHLFFRRSRSGPGILYGLLNRTWSTDSPGKRFPCGRTNNNKNRFKKVGRVTVTSRPKKNNCDFEFTACLVGSGRTETRRQHSSWNSAKPLQHLHDSGWSRGPGPEVWTVSTVSRCEKFTI